jgi:hypothetical protein
MADSSDYPVGSASVSWLDASGTIHIRVYSTNGYAVTERCWDGSGWTNGGFSQKGGAVSATCWQGPSGISIRVYCTFDDSTVEYCWDPGTGWYQGAYTVE